MWEILHCIALCIWIYMTIYGFASTNITWLYAFMFHVQSLNIRPFDQIKGLKNMVGVLNLLIIDIDFRIFFFGNRDA